MGTKQGQADTFQSGCFFVYCFSFIGVSKICKLEDFCRLLSASFPKGINCAPPSTSLSILHCLVVSSLHHLHSQSAVLADFASEAFYPAALLTHMQANAPIYILDMFLETCILGEVLSLPRFMVAFSLKPIQYLIWEWQGAASEKPFLFTSRSIWYYLAS